MVGDNLLCGNRHGAYFAIVCRGPKKLLSLLILSNGDAVHPSCPHKKAGKAVLITGSPN
jgi:hypothetical protein